MKRRVFLICLSILAVFTGIWLSPVYSMASSETELLKTEISHLREDVNELEQKMQDVDTKVDTHIANDSVTNGADGKDGKDGANGRDGTDGADGQDGADGKDGTDGKDAVYQSVGEKESVSTMEVVSMTVASAALLGNIVMIILNLKKKNI